MYVKTKKGVHQNILNLAEVPFPFSVQLQWSWPISRGLCYYKTHCTQLGTFVEESTKVIDMIFNLNELDNSGNLKDGRPSDALFTYYVSSSKDFTHFEPLTPQYKKLKNGEIVSLTLRITDQNNNVITDGLRTTVVPHICDRKI